MGKKETREAFQAVSRYSAIGLEIAISVGMGALIGSYLDKYLKTRPWLTLVFIFLGFVSGIKSLLRLSKKIKEDNLGRPRHP